MFGWKKSHSFDSATSHVYNQGRIQTMWKLWFHKVKLCNLYKIEKCGKKIGEKIGKIFNKIGENRNFHIVSIDTASAPDDSKVQHWNQVKKYCLHRGMDKTMQCLMNKKKQLQKHMPAMARIVKGRSFIIGGDFNLDCNHFAEHFVLSRSLGYTSKKKENSIYIYNQLKMDTLRAWPLVWKLPEYIKDMWRG